MKLSWVESSGGPLVLVPADALGAWEGCDHPSGGRAVEARSRWGDPSGSASDYDVACDVDGWIAVVRVGGTDALVLAGEPLATAWLPDGTGGALVRRAGALDDEAAARLAARAIGPDAGADRLVFAVESPELVLFDSAFRGDQPEAREYGGGVRIEPGRYAVGECVVTTPEGATALVVHAFSRRAG